jgi:hypothetical protein
MKRTWIGIAVVFAVVAGGVGYWLGVRQGAPAPQIAAQSATAADPAKKERKLL